MQTTTRPIQADRKVGQRKAHTERGIYKQLIKPDKERGTHKGASKKSERMKERGRKSKRQ